MVMLSRVSVVHYEVSCGGGGGTHYALHYLLYGEPRERLLTGASIIHKWISLPQGEELRVNLT